jgi:sugar lactone lactonase YvrE
MKIQPVRFAEVSLMSARGTRSFFTSIVQSVCLDRRPWLGLRSYVQLGVLLLVLCGYGQATAAAQVQLVPEITTFAGNGVLGFSGSNGPAASAELGAPQGVALDSAGNLYIADTDDSVIWKVTAATGTISVVAGNGTFGFSGSNGPATSAELGSPSGVVVDSAGNLYIADQIDAVIWKVTAATGTITVVAGNGTSGFGGSNGPAISAELGAPQGVALDSAGNLYIADPGDSVIWKVTAATGTITVVAGNGTSGLSGSGGPATSAELGQPQGVAVDGAGNIYIADFSDFLVWKVTAATGTITEVAGNGTFGFSGINGPASSAELGEPEGVAVDGVGNLYIADNGNSVIWMVSATTGTITVVAGNASFNFSGINGPAASAGLGSPTDVVVDSAGNFYIGNGDAEVLKVIATTPPFPTTAVGSTSAVENVFLQLSTAQTVTSITATPSQAGKQEYVGGTVTGCAVGGTTSNPAGTICTVPVTFQPAYAGNRGVSLQVVTSSGTFSFGLNGIGIAPQVALTPGTIVTAAGNGTVGSSGDGGVATSAELNVPDGVAEDSAGNLYIADALNDVIRKVTAATGVITTIAGNGTAGFSGDGGAATSAELSTPAGVAVDSAGNLYIADEGNQRIRAVSAGTGQITTIAGNGTAGFSGDNGAAASAELNFPGGVAIDSAGNLYIADSLNNRIRKVSAATGMIMTIAGNGTAGFSGDNGVPTSAELNAPDEVTLDSGGNLYISDSANNRIRIVSAATGLITTIAGNGTAGYSGDNGAATSAELNGPADVVLDSAGDLYIADILNNRIRIVTAATGLITTIAGNGTAGYSGDNGAATGAELNGAVSIALDNVGNLFIADAINQRIRELQVTMPPTLTFPTATVAGTTDTTDGLQTISLSNIGNATLIFPTAPSLSTGFTLDSSSTCPSGSSTTLLMGANCTLAVDFAPTTAGSISGALVVMDTALNQITPNFAMQSIPLSGMGTMASAPMVPTLTFTSIPTQLDGAAPFAVSATSASTGAVTYAVMSGPATIAGNIVTLTGTGSVVLTASQAASGNFTAATATTSFMVVLPFTLSAANSSMSVAAGATASFSLMLTPVTGTTLTDPITLAVTGLPAGATATFSPASPITLGSAAATVALSIQTAGSQMARNQRPITGNPLGLITLSLLLLPLTGIRAARKRLPQLPLVLLAVGLSLAAVLGMSGCGGHNAAPTPTPTPTPTPAPTPAPAAQTYTVVVTATDATTMIQSMTSLTLTVQ